MQFIISGEIDSIKVKKFANFVVDLDMQEPLYILINSEGGDEGCGRALAGMIRNLRDKGMVVNTTGFGDVQSAAVIVFAAGEKRLLSRYATVMVHESTDAIEGNASKIKKTSKQMESDEKFWCDIMQELTGTDSKIWMKLHEDETYLRPEEALKLNLATELI